MKTNLDLYMVVGYRWLQVVRGDCWKWMNKTNCFLVCLFLLLQVLSMVLDRVAGIDRKRRDVEMDFPSLSSFQWYSSIHHPDPTSDSTGVPSLWSTPSHSTRTTRRSTKATTRSTTPPPQTRCRAFLTRETLVRAAMMLT